LDKPGVEIARTIADRLLHTKSKQWSYEQEWRLAIPGGLKDGKEAAFYRFYPNEVVEVYLGFRMNNETKNAIIRMANTLNPAVRIFSAGLAKRKYAVEFTQAQK
jgi:hypothetical protein